MKLKKNQVNRCWICGKQADSSEHTIKKSDLVLIHGKGPYTDLIHQTGDKLSKLQGPNSDKVKYDKNLCYHCNTTFTKPFDVAYEMFTKWVKENEAKIVADKFIDFEEIYSEQWELQQRNLFKFFTKSIGCRINNIPRPVPRDLKRLLYKDHFLTRLKISFSINEYIVENRIPLLGKDDMVGNLNNPSFFNIFYELTERFLWLEINYWYNRKPIRNVGAPWVADSKFIYLGTNRLK
ncbi:MAG TPA: hypothetical protein VFO76_13815 [Candidatus Kapabacteria bacterium]|nr:hypothetical protein [Candidatus Kapabacteria bacterium]